MAELDINREDICARKNWRRNVMNRNSNPTVNRTINLTKWSLEPICICQSLNLPTPGHSLAEHHH